MDPSGRTRFLRLGVNRARAGSHAVAASTARRSRTRRRCDLFYDLVKRLQRRTGLDLDRTGCGTPTPPGCCGRGPRWRW